MSEQQMTDEARDEEQKPADKPNIDAIWSAAIYKHRPAHPGQERSGNTDDIIIHTQVSDTYDNCTYGLIQYSTDGTGKEWVAYTATPTADGADVTETGRGDLAFAAETLDRDVMHTELEDQVNSALDYYEEADQLDAFRYIRRHADHIIDELEDEWQEAARHVVSEGVYDGIAGFNGTTAWMSHVEEAFHHEVDRVMETHSDAFDNTGDDVTKDIERLLRETLITGVKAGQTSWQDPHSQYRHRIEVGGTDE